MEPGTENQGQRGHGRAVSGSGSPARDRGSITRDAVRLLRPRLGALVALSALTGHALAAGALSVAALLPAGCCFLLACGASALNQLQERGRDARMARTCPRPLPAGRMSPVTAAAVGAVLIVLGLSGLLLGGGLSPAAAAALALGWYHGVYTPLKRRTPYAAVPGALVGSLGPAIGWLAAGGAWRAPGLHALMLLFFLWQVPHFWLLALRHAEDLRRADLPSPVVALGRRHLGRVAFVWIAAAAVAALLLPLFGLLHSLTLYLMLCGLALALGALSTRLLRGTGLEAGALERSFARVNLFALGTMVLLLIDCGLRTRGIS